MGAMVGRGLLGGGITDRGARRGVTRAVRKFAPVLMAVALLLIFFTLAALAVNPDQGLKVDPALAARVFSTMTLIVLVIAGGIVLGRARFGDEATWVALGFATLSYAAGPVAAGEIAPALGLAVAPGVRAVLLGFAVGLFAEAVRARFRTRLWRVLGVGVVFSMASIVVATGFAGGAMTLWSPAVLVVLAAWTSAVGYFSRARGLRWFAVAIFGLALGELALTAESGSLAVWIINAGVVRMIGVLLAVLAVASDVMIAYGRRLQELEAVSTAAATLELRAIAAARQSDEQRHEAESALASIEFGLHALDSSSGVDADAVRHALSAEVGMLRRIVAVDTACEPKSSFDVWTAVTGVIAAQRLAGADIVVRIPPGLHVYGQPVALAEAIQAILDNAKKHAPGAQVRLEGRLNLPWVELRIEDQGAGVPPELAGSIFERTVTGSQGSGLGLFIAQRLLEDQGGRAVLDLTTTSGAAFVLLLPAGKTPNEMDEHPWRFDPHELVDFAEFDDGHQRAIPRLDEPNRGAGDGA